MFTGAASITVGSVATAQPVLNCTASAPVIIADNANVRYTPMPFPVTVTVTNTGTALASPVTATIIVPPDLHLAGDDAPNGYTKSLQPSWLFPQQSGQVQWMLRHPPTTMERQCVIKVWVKTPNADSSLCEATVIIPPLDSPILAPRCYVPDSLHFVDAEDSYVPNPFTVRLTCVNNGNTPAEDVTGTLILPPNVELVDPADSLSKHFSPSTLGKWRISDPVPELTWVVRWVPRLRVQAMPEFRFTVTGKSFAGVRLDSTEVRCQTRIHGLVPLFGGCMRIPDSLGLRADGMDVEPNPFTVRYPLRNISHISGRLSRVYLSFPPDGLTLNSSSPWPINSSLDTLVAPGDSIVFEWVIDVANRITRRNVLIQAVVIDDEGNPIMCEDRMPIANVSDNIVRWRLDGTCTSSEERLEFDKPNATYIPDTFLITGTVRNAGSLDLHEITTRITWLNPLDEQRNEMDLVELDPNASGNTSFRTHDLLHRGDSLTYAWKFRLKDWNRTWSMKYVRFNLEAGAKELSAAAVGNEARVEISPSKILTSITIPTPGICTLNPVHPNPFRASTTISFRLEKAAAVTLVVTDALGREVRRLLHAEYYSEGTHALSLDASGMTPGIYFVRMTVGEAQQFSRMILVR